MAYNHQYGPALSPVSGNELPPPEERWSGRAKVSVGALALFPISGLISWALYREGCGPLPQGICEANADFYQNLQVGLRMIGDLIPLPDFNSVDRAMIGR